jgi:hypothetical protein
MLLLSFSLSALAVVGAVGWAARTGSPLAVAAAVLLALGLTALVLLRLARMLPDRMRTPPRAGALVPGVLAAVLLGSLAIASVAHAPVRPSGSRAGTVRGFLGYVVNDNGVGACRYLTTRAQDAVQRDPLTGPGCAAAFDSAQLPGIATDAQLGRLHYAVRGRTVTVHGLRFVLQPATPSERAAFQAPATPWRIARLA